MLLATKSHVLKFVESKRKINNKKSCPEITVPKYCMCSFSAGRVVTPVNNLKLLIDHTKISTSSWLQFYFMFLSPFILWFIHFITYAGEFTSLTLELHCTQQFFACCAAQLFCFQRIVTNYIYIIHRFFWFFFFL